MVFRFWFTLRKPFKVKQTIKQDLMRKSVKKTLYDGCLFSGEDLILWDRKILFFLFSQKECAKSNLSILLK